MSLFFTFYLKNGATNWANNFFLKIVDHAVSFRIINFSLESHFFFQILMLFFFGLFWIGTKKNRTDSVLESFEFLFGPSDQIFNSGTHTIKNPWIPGWNVYPLKKLSCAFLWLYKGCNQVWKLFLGHFSLNQKDF